VKTIGSTAKKNWKKTVKIHPLLAARFAHHLREKRANRGMKLQEFADLLKVSNPYVHMLEHAQRTPSLEMVEQIANILGVDPAAMLEDPK